MKTTKYFSTTFIWKRAPSNLSEFNIYLIRKFKINAFEFVIKLRTTTEENINLR